MRIGARNAGKGKRVKRGKTASRDVERMKRRHKGGNVDTAGQARSKRRYQTSRTRTRVGNAKET